MTTNHKNTLPNNPTSAIKAVRIFLGGSFDPVHLGHTAMLQRVYNTVLSCYPSTPSTSLFVDNIYTNTNIYTNIHIDTRQKDRQSKQKPSQYTLKVYASFLPTARSPFKSQSTDAKHRLAMLTLACKNIPFTVCDIEIIRPSPTYTIDTLRLLRERYPDDSLIFVMGADSAMSLNAWREVTHLVDYAHLWVLPRQNMVNLSDLTATSSSKTESTQSVASVADSLPLSLQSNVTKHSHDLKNTLCGRIYIDTTDIILQLQQATFMPLQHSTRLAYKPPQTIPLISLPIMAVSSSDIRRAIVVDELTAIESSLSPEVLAYIHEHQLYVTES